jgi:hypothetical protein|tara:strand:- start:1116 stop:1340 length:225 start_codon:yes stop_codon:yes gene_type:complete
MTADASFKKGKREFDLPVWIVSNHDDPLEIMLKDNRTISRLELEFYGKTYKSEKRVTIKRIRSKKIVGHVNSKI